MAAPLNSRLKIKVQLLAGGEIAMGPGKAELLDWIGRTGSISAAARSMGVSYRRAWLMLDAMNRGFAEPVVQTAHGGAKGGGATITVFGERVLTAFRALEADLEAAAERHRAVLLRTLAK